MKQHTRASVVIAVTLLLGAGVAADSRKAAALLREAEVKDVVLGDVKGAIALYQRAVAESTDDPTTAARALLALGAAQQKVGNPTAREAYERVVRDFADQKEYASEARARLVGMGHSKRQAADTVPQRLLDLDESVPSGAVTPDGRSWLTLKNDAVVLYDLATGASRDVVPASRGTGLWPLKISGDGKKVAFPSFDSTVPPTARQYRLMVVDVAGGTPRTVATGQAGVLLEVIGFGPDGTSVLARCTKPSPPKQIEMLQSFSLVDGSTRVVRTFPEGAGIFQGRVSPDGRFVAYMSHVSELETRIDVLNLQTGVESHVVGLAATNLAPIWSPDGSHIVFYSSRSGARGLWSVAVREGVSVGDPTQLLALADNEMFSSQPVGVTAAGALLYTHAAGGGTTTFVMERGAAEPRTISTIGGMSGTFSPDGTSIAYIASHDVVNDLIVRRIDSGDERRYTLAGLGPVSPRWLPDGDRLIVVAKDTSGSGQAYFLLTRSSGEFARLFPVNTPEHVRSGTGALSPDGKTFFVSARADVSAPWTHIVPIDLATGKEGAAIEIPGGFQFPGAPGVALSPDGSTIAVEGKPMPGQSGRIVTLSVAGGAAQTTVSAFPLSKVEDKMRWTSDGQSLLFVAGTNGADWKLMRIAPTGGTAQTEYDPRTSIAGVRWDIAPWNFDVSRDGIRFLFGGQVRVRTELWSFDVAAALNGR